MSTATSALTAINNASNGTSTFDAQTYVNQIIAAEQGPETQMKNQVATLSSQATALGTLSSQLSSLQSAAFDLNNFQGALAADQAASSNSAVATATAAPGSVSGTHTLVVSHLATTSTQSSNVLADGNTAFAQGSFTVQVGSGAPTTITVDSSNDTLNQLAASINSQGLGFSADVLTDANGARISLVSGQSGAAGELSVSGNTTGLTLSEAQPGQNAAYTLDGVSLASAGNSVVGAIPGVTLNLLSAAPAAPVQITVTPDTSQMTTVITNFVNAYNTVVQNLNAQLNYNASTQSLGPLGSDVAVMNVQQQVLADASYAISGNGGVTNLAAIGVNMNSDGTLAIDSNTLNNALASAPSQVVNLFQQTGDTPGFAQNLVNNLLNLTDPTAGPLALDQKGITQSTSALNLQITAFQNQLNAQQTQLLAQYSQVEITLQQMPNLLDNIKSQLASLP